MSGYETPAITDLGKISDLTLQVFKQIGGDDGTTLIGVGPIGNVT